MDNDPSLVLQRILLELQLLRQQQTQTDEHMCWVKAKLETLEAVLCDASKPDAQERQDPLQPSQTHIQTHSSQGPATGGGWISADWRGPAAKQDPQDNTPPQREDGFFSLSATRSRMAGAAGGASARRSYTGPSWEADHDEHGDTLHSLKAANERAPLLAADSLAHKGGGKARVGGGCSEAGEGSVRPSFTWGEECEEEEEEEGASAAEQLTTFAAGVHRWLWGIILPYEKCMWDLFMLLLLVWVCFVSSYLISFGVEANYWQGDALGYVELLIDLAFLFDVYLNFRTAYLDDQGNLVTSRRKIAKQYVQGWFLLDLLSVIPFEVVFHVGSFTNMFKIVRVLRIARVMRLLKAYRMLRIIKLPRIMEALELWLNRNTVTIVMSVLACLFMVHLAACLFYFMAAQTGLEKLTWVSDQGLANKPYLDRYLIAVYWAVTTLCTVGYGDVTPKSPRERAVAVVLMILGVNMVGYVTSSIAAILNVRNSKQARIANKKQMIIDFLKDRHVPKLLSHRIQEFYHYVAMKEVRRDERDIITELPAKLRSKLLHHLYADTLEKVSAFKGQHPQFLADLVSCLKLEYFVEGDIVLQQGDPGTSMYFVGEGKLQVRVYDVTNLAEWNAVNATEEEDLRAYHYLVRGVVKAPFYFGQASCMNGGVCPATVIAATNCQLYALSRDNLLKVLESWPEVARVLNMHASAKDWPAGRRGSRADAFSPGGSAHSDRQLQLDFPYLQSYKHKAAASNSPLASLSNVLLLGLALPTKVLQSANHIIFGGAAAGDSAAPVLVGGNGAQPPATANAAESTSCTASRSGDKGVELLHSPGMRGMHDKAAATPSHAQTEPSSAGSLLTSAEQASAAALLPATSLRDPDCSL